MSRRCTLSRENCCANRWELSKLCRELLYHIHELVNERYQEAAAVQPGVERWQVTFTRKNSRTAAAGAAGTLKSISRNWKRAATSPGEPAVRGRNISTVWLRKLSPIPPISSVSTQHFAEQLSGAFSFLAADKATIRDYYPAVKEKGKMVGKNCHAVYAFYEYLWENGFLLQALKEPL